VLDHVSDEVNRARAERADDLGVLADRQLRVLARAILDGEPVGRLQHRFPAVAGVLDRARRSTDDDHAARMAAGHVVALELGWRLFGPFVRAAAGLDDVAGPVGASARVLEAAILADPQRWVGPTREL
jgi:hypothetical protein